MNVNILIEHLIISDLVRAILEKTRRNFTGQTLARSAVEVEEEEDVKRLVEAGTVDWNERAREDEDPAIMWALANDKLSVVQQLLKAPGIDLQVRDSDGWSLLSRAISKGEIGMYYQLHKYFTIPESRPGESNPEKDEKELNWPHPGPYCC